MKNTSFYRASPVAASIMKNWNLKLQILETMTISLMTNFQDNHLRYTTENISINCNGL